jgi:hypothetical protein
MAHRLAGKTKVMGQGEWAPVAARLRPRPAAAREALRAVFLLARLKPCPDTEQKAGASRDPGSQNREPGQPSA